MATSTELRDYSNCSFEDMVDLILGLEEDRQSLLSTVEELNELIVDLNARIEHLTDMAYS